MLRRRRLNAVSQTPGLLRNVGVGLSVLCNLPLTAGARTATELRPNIRALPGFDPSVATDFATGNPELRFSATTWNAGAGPLELVAGETGAGKQNVYQRIYRSDGTYYDRPPSCV